MSQPMMTTAAVLLSRWADDTGGLALAPAIELPARDLGSPSASSTDLRTAPFSGAGRHARHTLPRRLEPLPAGIFPEMHRIPRPPSEMGMRIQTHICMAIAERDPEAVLSSMLLAAVRLPAAERGVAAWLPTVIGLEELRRNGTPMFNESLITTHIKNGVRDVLGKMTHDSDPLWVVPVHLGDSCAAHVTAVVMTQQARIARPWPWRIAPPTDRFITVGAQPPEAGSALATRGEGHIGLIASDGVRSLVALALSSPHCRAAGSTG